MLKKLTDEIVSLRNDIRKNSWEIGIRLKQIRDGRLYKEKYKTFEEYLEKDVDMHRSNAYELIRVVEQLDVESMQHLGVAKCRLLLTLEDQAERDKWVKRIIEDKLTVSAIEKELHPQSHNDNEKVIAQVHEIPISKITPCDVQPRRSFTETSLRELAESIKGIGLIEPIIVRPNKDGYEVVAGERRFRAHGIAGLTTIQAIVQNYSDEKAKQVSIHENMHRDNLTPIEEARGICQALGKDEVTTEGGTELANFANDGLEVEKAMKVTGLSELALVNKLAVLDLDAYWQKLIREGQVPAEAVSQLTSLNPDQRIKLAENMDFEKCSYSNVVNAIRAIRQKDSQMLMPGADKETTRKTSEDWVYQNYRKAIGSICRFLDMIIDQDLQIIIPDLLRGSEAIDVEIQNLGTIISRLGLIREALIKRKDKGVHKRGR